MHYRMTTAVCLLSAFITLNGCYHSHLQSTMQHYPNNDPNMADRHPFCEEIKHRLIFPNAPADHRLTQWHLPSNQAMLMKLYNRYHCESE